MKVIKRNGTEARFDKDKIRAALHKADKAARETAGTDWKNSSPALTDSSEVLSSMDIGIITAAVENRCKKLGRSVGVEEIQDMIIDELDKSKHYRVARIYSEYRVRHELLRKRNSTDARILSLLRHDSEIAKQENANKDPVINSTMRDYLASEVSEDICRRYIFPEDVIAAHDEGRDDLALIIAETLRQRKEGVKNETGAWVSPAFPKLLYVLDENNVTEDSPYWHLTVLAAECTAKRMVPDYISAKIMKQLKNGDVYPCMGCRAFLTPDTSGMEPDGSHKYYGRFNQGAVTVNLVDAACSADGDEAIFWELLNERCELCHKALRVRHETLLGTPSDVAPILWQHGAISRLAKGEKIDRLLYDNYSTISLGYAGLCECVYRMKGVSHTDPAGHDFAVEVMKFLNKKTAEWRTAENISYSLYGTPMESSTYKFAKCLQKRFEIIPHVTDKMYITNSYHIHVTEPVDAFSKLGFEAEFQALSPGGAISYVEVPDMRNNIPAVLAVIVLSGGAFFARRLLPHIKETDNKSIWRKERHMKYNDKNKPLVCMMTQSTCYKYTGRFTPKGILWHSTGANNPWLKRYVQPDDKAADRDIWIKWLGKNQYNNDWNHCSQQIGLNFWIGKLADGTVAAVQTMPFDYRPWGCGSGPKGSCNNTHIQFEICEDALNDKAYFDACYKEACEMTAYLCKKFGIDPKGTTRCNGVTVPTIIDHAGSHEYGLGSNHGDIRYWGKKFGKTMADVRNDVAALLRETDSEKPSGKNVNSTAVILKRGSKGEAVKTMQTMLIACGYSCGSCGADGSFGAATLPALKAFQKAAGLDVDGIYGPKSRAALEKAYKAKKPSQPVYYRVRKADNSTASQIGAFTVYENAVLMADANPGYFVFKEGVRVYPPTAAAASKSS